MKKKHFAKNGLFTFHDLQSQIRLSKVNPENALSKEQCKSYGVFFLASYL